MLNDSIVVTIQEILAERVGKNHRYSLRSLAKQLGISHPYLSRIISRRRKISPALRKKIEKKLQAITGRPELKLGAKKKLYTASEAKQLLHWKYSAILNLIQARGFISTPAWLAKHTGLEEDEIKEAIELMKELGLILLGPKGKLLRTYDVTKISPEELGEKVFRKYFLDRFDLVTKVIEKDALSEEWAGRVQTILLGRDQIRDAQLVINQCIKDLVELGESSERSDKVYVAAFGLTPLISPTS